MIKKLIKISLIGKTNAGKSTLLNNFVGEEISIVNKKINTTNELILGIFNYENTQIILYDTPGSNLLISKNNLVKNAKSSIWEAIDNSDLIVYVCDSLNFIYKKIKDEISKISSSNKKIIVVFNKIDLIDKKKVLPYTKELNELNLIDSFFFISAKYNKGLNQLTKYLVLNAKKNNWVYDKNIISNKDKIFISNECTRNAILKHLHKEIPYKLNIRNIIYKKLKNDEIKIKQIIEIFNYRYKAITIGKSGSKIKRIREESQKNISKIFNTKIHLYLKIELKR